MRHELRDARRRFVQTWDKRLAELEALTAAAADAAAREDLGRAAHRLVGAAGVVGFPSVSDAARALEKAVAADEPAETLASLAAALREAHARDDAAPPEWVTETPGEAPLKGDADAHGPTLTLVVAEDDDVQQLALVRFLERAGHTVTGVARGDEVLDVVRRVTPDILMLDVQLPGIDGYTLCRHVKADPALASVGVVFLTAAISTDDRLAGFLLGADDYIEKPVDLADLGLRISTVAARRAAAASKGPRLATGELSYPDFIERVTDLIAKVPGTLVLLRMPSDVGQRVAMWLTGELRRGDLLGKYRDDLRILFFPNLIGRTATLHVGDIVGRLGASGLTVSSGLASSARPGERALSALLQDADASLAASAARPAPATTPRAAGADGPHDDGGPSAGVRRRTVVIADDDQATRLIAVRPLMRVGIPFRTAADGKQALEMLAAEMPEVLVLDLDMPEVDGIAVLEALGRHAGPKPRVIVVSSHRDEARVQRALSLGAEDYVVKPFNPLMLLDRIRRLMH